MRRFLIATAVSGTALVLGACGGAPPLRPTPGGSTPPLNNPPVIDSITIQGSRTNQPANFADPGESIPVSARVHDDETAADQLQFAWTATAGSFTGTGTSVVWIAPAAVAVPTQVTLTLTVTEKYGTGNVFQHSTVSTGVISLHDSLREVATMSRQFLLDFSDTTIKDANRIMQNFGGAGTCPDPGEVSSERQQVTDHYTYFRMLNFRVDQPSVTVKFGGACPTVHGLKRGDACAYVGVMWDSIDTRDNSHAPNAGTDQIAAAYSAKDARWFLCSSDYDGHLLSNPAVAVRYPR